MTWAIGVALLALAVSIHAEWRATRADRRSLGDWERRQVNWQATATPGRREGEFDIRVENAGHERADGYPKVDPASLMNWATEGTTMNVWVEPGKALTFTIHSPRAGARLESLTVDWVQRGKQRKQTVPVRWPELPAGELPSGE